MFNHVMVGTNDIGRARRFYDNLLGSLGIGAGIMDRNAAGMMRLFYLHPHGIFCVSEPLDGAPATSANGGTIGFRCHSERQVLAFHNAAIAAGGTSIEQPPGLRSDIFGGPMHLAYVRDPDGNKLCAVHRPASGKTSSQFGALSDLSALRGLDD